MWDFLGTAAWLISAAIFLWLAWDFFVVNKQTSEELLLSSREGVDELFAETDSSKKGRK
jgi:hypothetical protein